jgi:3-hydroxyacyl-CoA dehydrogenase
VIGEEREGQSPYPCDIRTVTVLGANGTMGALCGGVLAQCGLEVFFLAREERRARAGLEAAVEQARSEHIGKNVVCADYGELPRALGRSQWVLECLAEDAALKHEFFAQVDRRRRPRTIVSTVSSVLSVAELAAGRSEDFRRHFFGTHFYNPPARLPAVELVPHAEVEPALVRGLADFLARRLRRVVVPTADTPGFAGNRIGFQLMNEAALLVGEWGVETVDYLYGPYTGRKMAPLATIDLVGLDVHREIVNRIARCTADERRATFRLPPFVDDMVEAGRLGNKTPETGGLYRAAPDGGRPLVFDPTTKGYRPAREVRLPFVEEAKACVRVGEYRRALDIVKGASGPEADISRRALSGYVSYAFHRIGEVTEASLGIEGIDQVMVYGFAWAPPSAVVDMLGGPKETISLIRACDLPVPASLEALAHGGPGGRGRLFTRANPGQFFLAA